jgi:hypothetical protein
MAQPSTRAEFTDYCLRKLGAPVLEINVDDDQVDDLIDDAIQFYQEYHFDGVEKMYLKHKLTTEEITRFQESNENTLGPNDTPPPTTDDTWEERNNFLQVPDHVIGISQVWGLSSSTIRGNLFGLEYRIFLNDLYSFGSVDLLNYYMTKQYLETIDMVINSGSLVGFRFNKRQDRLYVDVDPSFLTEDNYLIIECHRALNPVSWSQVWNDSFLKKYATALIKRQWGQNMIKFNNVQLPGGVTMNGRQLFEDGNTEVLALEEKMMTHYQLPPLDMIG